MTSRVKKFIKKQALLYLIIKKILLFFNKQKLKYSAKKNQIKLTFSKCHIDFQFQNKIIRLSISHYIYSIDIINSFDYYYNSVIPNDDFNGNLLVDFSTSKYHDVIGFEKQPIIFPSLAEPVITTTQYLEFANLKEDSVVIDLGAYSGLTSILFKLKCFDGEVIAVDADDKNLSCMIKNFKLFKSITNLDINVLNGAVWSHSDGLFFSNEGNMGSSAVSIIGERGGDKKFIKSYKLSDIARMYQLSKVDFIKCDIEGAEAVIFEDDDFFQKFKPKIIVEPHFVNGEITTGKVEQALKKYGYKINLIEQHGVALPLLNCEYSN
jgi:FkbM family methyltransferase